MRYDIAVDERKIHVYAHLRGIIEAVTKKWALLVIAVIGYQGKIDGPFEGIPTKIDIRIEADHKILLNICLVNLTQTRHGYVERLI